MDFQLWLAEYRKRVSKLFSDRILFLGIQGSYARGEMTETSDVDVVLILDRMELEDLEAYRVEMRSLPQREKLCGFLSGAEELRCWERGDLFQFYYDTKPLYGSLDSLIQIPGKPEALQAVQNGACNLYHTCSHNLLHERSEDLLMQQYKTAVFILKAKYFYETGCYVARMDELERVLGETDQEILRCSAEIKKGQQISLSAMGGILLHWLSHLIVQWIPKQRE